MDFNYDLEKEAYINAIASGEDIERSIASFDNDFNIFVSNKAFKSYFSITDKEQFCILDAIHNDDIEGFKAFVKRGPENGDNDIMVRINVDNAYRINVVKFNGQDVDKDISDITGFDYEFVDVATAVGLYEKAVGDVAKSRLALSLSNDFLFTYDKETNIINVYKYDEFKRVDLYVQDIDEWSKFILDNDMVSKEDVVLFETFIQDLKAYLESFSVKLTSKIFTRNKKSDTRIINACLYKGVDGERIILGRAIKDVKTRSMSAKALEGELTIDQLTGVYNKKTITEYAKKLLLEEKENKVVISILDLDHFKTVNDSFGHLYGDKVLARAGHRLKEVVGSDGVVGRIGGDEFLIVFTGLNDDQALRGMLRAIRTQIKWEFANDFEGLSITCSIGASIFPTNGTDYEDLFKKADCCLYIAKEKGRDRYVYFRDELHKNDYEATLNGNEFKAINNTREIRELQYVSKFLKMANQNPQDAITDAMFHLSSNFGIDNISVYYGDSMERIFSFGQDGSNMDRLTYADTEEFKRLLAQKNNCFDMGFVSHYKTECPIIHNALESSGISSTIQCAIVEGEKIKGVVTYNKFNSQSQWANYEVDCASVFASFINIISNMGKVNLLANASVNALKAN